MSLSHINIVLGGTKCRNTLIGIYTKSFIEKRVKRHFDIFKVRASLYNIIPF